MTLSMGKLLVRVDLFPPSPLIDTDWDSTHPEHQGGDRKGDGFGLKGLGQEARCQLQECLNEQQWRQT